MNNGFVRMEQHEKMFKNRYNRDVEVYKRNEFEQDRIKTSIAKIILPALKKEFTITEHLTPQELTDFVIVSHNDKNWKYKDYLLGEIFVADLIGGYINGNGK